MSRSHHLACMLALAPSVHAAGAEDRVHHPDNMSAIETHSEHLEHATDGEPTESERAHVPPEPPQHLGDMATDRMIELMQMDDDASFGMLLLDQFEGRDIDDDALMWELDAWYGDDYDKIWLETEGERTHGEQAGSIELMWDRTISPRWSFRTGLRQVFGPSPSRTWLDVGIQGLAPYFFEIDAAIYIGEQGHAAARFSGEYDILITQRSILQPELELWLYGESDVENGIGSGLSTVEFGLRLRHEVRRELAPYLGVHWERKIGPTARLARDEGENPSELVFVAGVRMWF